MKTIKLISIAVLASIAAASFVSCNNVDNDPEVAELRPSQGATDSVSYLLGINFGMIIKSNNIAEDISEINVKEMLQGMKDAFENKENPRSEAFAENFKINPMMMNEIISNFISKRGAYKAMKNKKEGEIFLEKLSGKDGYVKTPSGLVYQIIEAGDSLKAVVDSVTVIEGADTTKKAVADTVVCHYKGTFINGVEFDSTSPEGEGATFPLDQVITGWTEGMQLVGQGGKIMLYIPAELGYGDSPNFPEPNSTLIFEVTLDQVKKAQR